MATKKKADAVDPYPSPEPPPDELIAEDVEDPNAPGEPILKEAHIATKDLLCYFLWNYSRQTKDEGLRAEIVESHDVLKKGLVKVWAAELDKEKGHIRLAYTKHRNYSRELINEHLAKYYSRYAIAQIFGLKQFLKVNKDRDPLKPSYFKVGRHGLKQLTGKTGPQMAMTFEEASKVENYIEQAGLQVTEEDKERLLEGWGADLTVTEHSVLLAILERMSAKNYQGDSREGRREVLTRAGVNPPGGSLPQLMQKALRNIKDFPVVRLYLHEVVELAGLDKERQGDKMEVKQALEHLGTARYAFYWERLAYTEHKGKKIPIRDQDGKYVKEGVEPMAGTILYIKRIVDPQSGQLDYYEISPSEPFLEQVTEGYGAPGGYFLMMPTGLLDKVRKAVGPGRRVTPHYYTFLYWLLATYADRIGYTPSGKEPNLRVRKHYEEIAQLIRMPETIWKRNRKKAVERLDSIYQAAKVLGYLNSYSMGKDGIVTLELDPAGPFFRSKKDQERLLGKGEKGVEA